MLRTIDNGTYGNDAIVLRTSNDPAVVNDDMIIDGPNTNALPNLIDFVYPSLPSVPVNELATYLSGRAILAPKNDVVGDVNIKILNLLPVARTEDHRVPDDDVPAPIEGEQPDQGAIDVVHEEAAFNYPVEFLNSITVPGFPTHRLELKVNATIMLLRSLCIHRGLCNGTRLM
ncbi:hypothetical protein ACHHYP_06846, partial [Achlya hypogyna]